MDITTNDFYTEWIERLKSGDYPKTSGRLRTGEGYCCLGVACDQFDPNDWFYNPRTDSYDHGIASRILPNSLQDKLNFYSPGGVFDPTELPDHLQTAIQELQIENDFESSLTMINDVTDNFDLIIAILEERPPSLFA